MGSPFDSQFGPNFREKGLFNGQFFWPTPLMSHITPGHVRRKSLWVNALKLSLPQVRLGPLAIEFGPMEVNLLLRVIVSGLPEPKVRPKIGVSKVKCQPN